MSTKEEAQELKKQGYRKAPRVCPVPKGTRVAVVLESGARGEIQADHLLWQERGEDSVRWWKEVVVEE